MKTSPLNSWSGVVAALVLSSTTLFAASLSVGDILVAQQSGSVLRIQPAGAQESLMSGDIAGFGVKLSPDHQYIYITDIRHHAIHRLHVATGVTNMLSSSNHLSEPQSIAITRNGDLLVTCFLNDKLVKVDANTGAQTVLAEGGLLDSPLGTAWYRPGKLLVGNYDTGSLVLVDSTTGSTTLLAAPGKFTNPYYLDVDTSGRVYVGNYAPLGGNRVQRFDPALNSVSVISTGNLMSSPLAPMLEESGMLVVANHLNRSVIRVNPSSGVQTALSSLNLINLPRAVDIVRAANTSVLTFTAPGGYYTNSVTVDFLSKDDGSLYYTLDGSEPTTGSTAYTGALTFTNGVTLKARLFLGNTPLTEVVTAQYDRVYAFANDGITAAWRIEFFGEGYLTDPRAGASADPDNDGALNIQEFLAGTDPLDPLSGFAVGIRVAPVITWNSVVGVHYRILRTEFLVPADWQSIVTMEATGTTSTFVDLEHRGGTGFYSVEIAPAP